MKKIHTGEIYRDPKNGDYIAVDSSWNSRGNSGRFNSGRVISVGNAHYLNVLAVEGWEPLEHPDIRGLSRVREREGLVFPELKCQLCDSPASHTLTSDDSLYCEDCASTTDNWSSRMRQNHTLSSVDSATIERLANEAIRLFPYCTRL